MAEDGHKVILNVYDLSQGLARQLSAAFLGKPIEGIWHTGVVVYDTEYYFSGGIQHDLVGQTPYGTPIKVEDLGVTHVPKDVFETYLEDISPRYTAETYSLLTHNCNNFSNEVSQFLSGATIPEFILQLPNEVMSSPMSSLIMPMIQNLETTLKSGAVPSVPQFRPSSSIVQPSQTIPSARGTKLSSQSSPSSESKSEKDEQKSTPNGISGDPLGDARSKVQEEIGKEFAAIMASGTLRASEAAALATRRVMQRYGNTAVSQS